jgi:hypothetical protein
MDMQGKWGNKARAAWQDTPNWVNGTGHTFQFDFLVPMDTDISGSDAEENILNICDVHGTNDTPVQLWVWNGAFKAAHKYKEGGVTKVVYYDGPVIEKERNYTIKVSVFHSTAASGNAYANIWVDGVQFMGTTYGKATCFDEDAANGSWLSYGLYPINRAQTHIFRILVGNIYQP